MDVSELSAIDTRIFSGVNLFWGDITLLLVLSMFVIKAWRFNHKWYDDMAVRGAIGLAVYCVGMMLVRGWSVPLLILTKHGYPTIALENAYPVSLIGTAIAMVGMYCMVRVFSPVRWSFWGWVVPGAIALATGSIAVYM